MRNRIVFFIALVGGPTLLGACSSAPPQQIIIIRESAGTGGQQSSSGSGGAPPITFMPAGGAAPAPPSQTQSGGASSAGAGASTGGITGSSGSSSTGPTGAAMGVPCDVATYLSAKCLSCHGAPPLPSALASLVTYDDLQAKSKEDPTKNEAELSLARMKNAAAPMPPGALPSAADVALLETWISAGYPMGSCGGDADGGGAPPPPPPPPASVFKNAPAFTAQTGPRAHNAGKDCMSCHRTGGGEAPRFSFGGTLYDQKGSPVAGAEVRLVDASGKAVSAYTSSTGTFYSGTTFAAPAHVGARSATASSEMLSELQAADGACSSCHCTGANCTVGLVHLP